MEQIRIVGLDIAKSNFRLVDTLRWHQIPAIVGIVHGDGMSLIG